MKKSAAQVEHAFRFYARLARLKQHLEANLSERLTTADAARIAGVSRNYFSAFFSERVGIGFKAWSESVRIEAATQRLIRSDESITEVAWEVGFRTLRSFERAFRRRTDMTPRQFQRWARPAEHEGRSNLEN